MQVAPLSLFLLLFLFSLCSFLFFFFLFFFFNDTATTEIYTLSLHDALPILLYWLTQFSHLGICCFILGLINERFLIPDDTWANARIRFYMTLLSSESIMAFYPLFSGVVCSMSRWWDRKSTRLNSSHWPISYAVFCLKKKKKQQKTIECSA